MSLGEHWGAVNTGPRPAAFMEVRGMFGKATREGINNASCNAY